MGTDLVHEQLMTFPEAADVDNQLYIMQASCQAHADEPARTDGLFAYLEGLGTVPGAGEGLANVEDVVAYCLEHQAPEVTAGPTTSGGPTTSSPGESADSTGTGTGSLGTTADSPEPPPVPAPCGPHATQRFWVRPSNNFGAWNEDSEGVGGVDAATFTMRVTDGGIAYTLFPCDRAPGAACLRVDQLSALVTSPGSGLVMHIGLVEESILMPVTAQGTFEVPFGALRFAARYAWDGQERFHFVTNDQRVSGRLDTSSRSLHIEGLGVSTEQGDTLTTLSLATTLSNSQPSTQIVESRAVGGGVVFTAKTFDPDSDEIVHYWMIPGVGSWRGDSISPLLPVGRHAVILYADDLHRARGVAARWVDVTRPAIP